MTPSPALVAQQTAEVQGFLRGSCRVCLVPHDPETHEATLRVRASLIWRPAEIDTPEKTNKAGCFREIEVEYKCRTCGVAFTSIAQKGAKYCPACRVAAADKRTQRANGRQRERRQEQKAARLCA